MFLVKILSPGLNTPLFVWESDTLDDALLDVCYGHAIKRWHQMVTLTRVA